MSNLFDTFVVIGPDQSAVPVDATPTVFEELDRRFDGFKGRQLKIAVPTALLFITPGEATQNRDI